MLAHHRDLGITPDQRFRFASLMSLAADDAGLPDDPEFRAAFVGYVEWGTRLALHNSQPGADVVAAGAGPALGMGRRTAVPALSIRAASVAAMPVDQSLVGKAFPPTEPFTVTAEHVQAFVESVGGEYAGGPAPATYPIVLAFDAMNAFLEASGSSCTGSSTASSGSPTSARWCRATCSPRG